MTKGKAIDPIEDIRQAHLPQIVTPLLIMAALRQGIAVVRRSYEGVEVGRVVGQQPMTDHLLFFPQGQQAQLCPIQLIRFSHVRTNRTQFDLVKTIPESL